jgi:hypothetical protein
VFQVKESGSLKTLNPKNTHKNNKHRSIDNLYTPPRRRTKRRRRALTHDSLVLALVTEHSPQLLASSEIVFPNTGRRLPRVRSFVPTVRNAFDHFVHDVLANFRAREAVAEGLAFVEQHVPFAGVQDDFVGEAVLEEGGGRDARGEVGGVEGDGVGWVKIAVSGRLVCKG